MLDLGSLRKAVDALDRALGVTARSPVFPTLDQDLRETLRAGVIQNFEMAYEQCWKMMRRWLETNVGSDSVDGISRRELFRRAAEERLLDDVDAWMGFHFSRNLTSHTYSDGAAQEAFEKASAFLPHAIELLSRLEAHND